MSEKKAKNPLLDDNPQQVEDTTVKSAKMEMKVTKPETPLTSVKTEIKDEVALTKAILDKAPHINFLIPLAEGEKAPAYETVQINGYKLTVEKGKMVNIPMPVANLLAEKYRIQMEAGKDKRVDRASDILEALD
jgi:hypothetical protein